MNPSTDAQRPVFRPAALEGERTAPWTMSWYVLWKVVGAILVLFLVLTATFVLVEVVPGDPLAVFVPPRCGGSSACSGLRAQIIAQWGLDQPLPIRYGRFLANVLTGNLGYSSMSPGASPVSTLILDAFPTTLALLGVALLLVALLSLALGFVLSRKRGSVTDAVVSAILGIPFAATTPILGTLAFYALVVKLRLVQIPSPSQGIDLGYDAIVMVFLVGSVAALFTWIVRDHPLRPPAAVSVPGDWRAPTNPQVAWLRRVAAVFLASLPPLLAWTITAVLLSEIFWNLNGLGSLLIRGVLTFDFLTVMGVLLAIGLLVILPILIAADLLHEWLTSTWVRVDGRSAEDLRLDERDVPRGALAVLNSASGFAGLVLIAMLIGMTLAAPLLVGPYPNQLSLSQANQPPSAGHLLGTDFYGRDELALVLYGALPAIPVALLAFAIALWTGTGLVALEGVLGRRADVFLSVPLDAGLILGSLAGGFLALEALGRSLDIVPALLAWPITARILLLEIRGLVRAPRDFWPGLRVSRGNRAVSLVWGTSPLILGNAFLSVAFALSLWAAFGIFGLGAPIRPGIVFGWADLLGQAWNNLAVLRDEWWTFIPPSLGILTAVLAPTLLALSLKRIPLRRSGPTPPTAIPPPVQESPIVPNP